MQLASSIDAEAGRVQTKRGERGPSRTLSHVQHAHLASSPEQDTVGGLGVPSSPSPSLPILPGAAIIADTRFHNGNILYANKLPLSSRNGDCIA